MKNHPRETTGYLLVFLLFFMLLTYFVFGNGWYAPATLVIEGRAPENRAELEVAWDSGAGWNTYEQRTFPVQTFWSENPDGKLSVLIRPTGEKHPGSLSTEVVCSRIRIDGKEMNLKGIDHTGRYGPEGIRLSVPGERIRLAVSATEHIDIELLTNNHSGKVLVAVNDHRTVRDLYIANEAAKSIHLDFWIARPDGRFTVKMDMPRYEIQTFRFHNRQSELPIHLTSLSVSTGKKNLQLSAPEHARPLSTLKLPGVNAPRKEYFQPARFAAQVVFAFLTTWFIVAAYRWICRQGGIFSALFSGKRYIFWIFFTCATGVYSFWLAAFWPGVMSVDSLKVWRAALLPDVFINDHPFFFVLFYTYLQHLWNHVAVVPVFHILTVSTLIAFVLFSFYRENMPLWAVAIVFVSMVFSIPIGLYNIVLWKDIPFAVLVAFWAYILSSMYRKRRQGEPFLSFQQKAVLILLYLGVGLVRHNGLLYLGLIPVFLVVLRIVPTKIAAVTLAAVLFFSASGLLIFRSRIPGSNIDFLLKKSAKYLKHPKGVSLGRELKRTFQEYWGILNINQTRSRWDLWHYYLGDREAYWFLLHSGWWDVYPYVSPNHKPFASLKRAGMKIYWKSYESPWVYLTWNPVYLLALFPLPLLLFRWLPGSAVYSAFILAQVLVLLGIIGVLNWRYYYFYYFGLFFMPLLILRDLKDLKAGRAVGTA
ncbi:MAG: hypothetical protein JRK26_11255 [Deltaproteobacteria bacterium]|nr:hypothetical protein [Deltaproteobacteria bacterium]